MMQQPQQPMMVPMQPQQQYAQPQQSPGVYYVQPQQQQYQQQQQYVQQPQPVQYSQAPQQFVQPGVQQPQYAQQPNYAQNNGGAVYYQPVPQQSQAVVISHSPAGPPVPGMIAPPQVPANTPPGLEYFASLDQMWIMQQASMLELATNWETNSKFQCLNGTGQQVYWAEENTNCCTRQCCGSMRPCQINCFDPTGKAALKLSRPFRCNSSWLGILPINCCFLQEMTVVDVNDALVGRVVQKYSLLNAWWDLVDNQNNVLLSIEAPYCVSSCCSDVEFRLIGPTAESAEPRQVGSIFRKWKGIFKEAFLPNVDTYHTKFPINISVQAKALVFAACFLIDFMYFEQRPQKPQQRRA